jgi:ribosomal protein S18 acetylase RimI-like enzyme
MIRRLNEKDLDQFIKIRKDSLQLDAKSFGADPGRKIDTDKTVIDLKAKNDENFILGYFEQDQLVGILGFIRYENVKTKHKGFIWDVYVYEKFRGTKIGEQLLKSCIDHAQKLKGLEKILLGASHISDNALGLYSKMGFEIYGRETNAMIWEGEYIDEILMEKIL